MSARRNCLRRRLGEVLPRYSCGDLADRQLVRSLLSLISRDDGDDAPSPSRIIPCHPKSSQIGVDF
jgi:hypothetical protein